MSKHSDYSRSAQAKAETNRRKELRKERELSSRQVSRNLKNWKA